MPVMELVIGGGLILIVVLAVVWMRAETRTAATAQHEAKTSKEAFDAVQRAQQAEARTRGMARSERLNWLLQRARRRTASKLPRDE